MRIPARSRRQYDPGKNVRGRHPTTCDLRAFTLIEFLVVVAIITVLLAILLPALRKMREAARQVKCMAMLDSLSNGVHLYANAYNGHFYLKRNATMEWFGKTTANQTNAGRPYNPYMGLKENAKAAPQAECPSDRGLGRKTHLKSAYDYAGTSFTTNGIIIGAPPHSFRVQSITGHDPAAKRAWERLNGRRTQLTMGNIKRPGRVWIGGDAGAWHQFLPLSSFTGSWHTQDGSHNLFYADGHAALTRVVKGRITTGDYTINPFGAGLAGAEGDIGSGVAE